MNKRDLTRTVLFAALYGIIGINVYAQEKEYPQQERMKPGMSEYWTPQPPIVTPGACQGNGLVSPPSDAIILFDGKDLSAWESAGEKGGPARWTVKDGIFTVDKKTGDIQTRQKFESYQLHIEWRIPENISGTSQSRGNSGVYMQGKYEIQILDCYQNETYVNGQTGSVYKQTPPLSNAMRKPGEWNVYDIIYTAPVFKEDGGYRYPPTVTVIQNGILLQNHTTILGTTEYIGFPQVQPHGAGPIVLQSHGDPSEPISFRNIWIREL
ncbi:MAG: DUF1080 domain-containing protein [Tannerellaceae bacterium]|jgi:hypothetical protein|nr:DUF1080 domain-containing protein [Tannerellaceae bacterium]